MYCDACTSIVYPKGGEVGDKGVEDIKNIYV